MKYCLLFLAPLIIIVKALIIPFNSFLLSFSDYKPDNAYASAEVKSGTNCSWVQTDTSVALEKNGTVIWQFNFNKKYDKPYFYPVRTGNTLKELVSSRPPDHPWHRGLWFSWKMINNVNYWEEDPKTRLSEGRAKIDSVKVKLNKNFSVLIDINLTYGPENKRSILSEERMIYVSPPDKSGNYFIDWTGDFKAKSEQLIFERTLPAKLGGPFYGGYAGLSIRAAETITDHNYIDARGWKNTKDIVGYGEKAEWMDLTGVIDSSNHLFGGIAIFNHPSNVNSPSPWYVYKDKQFAFFNSALLFEKPLTLEPFKHLHLSYRILVHEDKLSEAILFDKYKNFSGKPPGQ